MRNFKISNITKILLAFVVINIFFVCVNVYFPNQTSAFAKVNLQKMFLWPLNQVPGASNNITNISLHEIGNEKPVYQEKIDYEQRIINVVKDADQSVVSIVASKNLPVMDNYTMNPFDMFNGGTLDPFNFYFNIPDKAPNVTPKYEKQEVSSGSGFIITNDGYIVTNKHVVSDLKAEYVVFLNDGTKYNAKVIAQDPLEDFALLKIEASNLKALSLGNSDSLQLGQSVIAIGNALGEFQNTISVGVISGLNRSITASGGNTKAEKLTNLLQTDAAINRGNSGGPLLSLNGKVIGMNTAIVASAQNIGFAIPINKIKTTIEQAVKTGRITVPFIGVYYVQLDKIQAETRKLDVDYGALLVSDQGASAILKDSPAQKAGLKEGDIILTVNGEKITSKSPLSSVVRKYKPNETIVLEVKRGKETMKINLILGTK